MEYQYGVYQGESIGRVSCSISMTCIRFGQSRMISPWINVYIDGVVHLQGRELFLVLVVTRGSGWRI